MYSANNAVVLITILNVMIAGLEKSKPIFEWWLYLLTGNNLLAQALIATNF